MIRLYGWAEVGHRLIDAVPHGHWNTSTFIAGLRQDGLVAPCVFNGAINGELFLAYVEQVLVPTLTGGDVVVMDNLGSHKVAGVRKAIEAVGPRFLYLPSYSPDLNPIEQAFTKFKALLRAKALRTVEALWNALGDIVACFSPAECANFLRNAGYSLALSPATPDRDPVGLRMGGEPPLQLPESVSSSSSGEARPFFRITLRITLWTTDFVLVRSHRTPAWFHGAGSQFARANWREKTFATLPRNS